uniref:NADH-ubiquinone oxidoreductase chain 3 n=1 Tax=Tenebrionoidea sp. 22 KM-2017 TaxID=2219478 RepID=A0A346RKK9_9CUCU|nr:NADH dehydrogenase subunit 3 [Tenebrionoidea sp. 22 KM-2017]
MLMIFIFFLIFIITMILIILLNLISKKSFMDREKSSPFECGFDPKSSTRLSFSLNFFLISIIFLIFDIEITLLFPFILNLNFSNMFYHSMIFFYFIIILLIGLFHEWNQGALNWKF